MYIIICLFFLKILSSWADRIDDKYAMRKEKCKLINKELDRILEKARQHFGFENNSISKPKYRMKEVNEDDDLLFLSSSADFDEAFKL